MSILNDRGCGCVVQEWPVGRATHPGDELRAIKRYLKQREDRLPWLFISEREQAMTRRSVNYIVENAADRAGLDPVHPHMLRHSCGFYLADQGYDLRIDSGLPGTSRSQAHRSLHARCR